MIDILIYCSISRSKKILFLCSNQHWFSRYL